jgi:hypothetical protein
VVDFIEDPVGSSRSAVEDAPYDTPRTRADFQRRTFEFYCPRPSIATPEGLLPYRQMNGAKGVSRPGSSARNVFACTCAQYASEKIKDDEMTLIHDAMP